MSTSASNIAIAVVAALAVGGVAGCSADPTSTPTPVPPAATASAVPSGGSTATPSTGLSATTPSTTVPSTSTSPPDGTVAAAAWEALMGPEGEYAAAAAYAAVLERYGDVEPYLSIEQAELHHVAALTRQLQRLGYAVPANPWTGQIPAPDSLEQAARAWADGEVANIALYDQLLAQVEGDTMLTRVFTNLQRASEESHLPLFTQAADNGGTIPADQMPAMAGSGGPGGSGPGPR